MKNIVGLYNEEKMLRGKNTIFEIDFPVVILAGRLCIDPHSMSENAALEGTPLTLFTTSPLWGVSQFKRYATRKYPYQQN